MSRWIVLLFVMVIIEGNVFAQGMNARMDKDPVQWTQNIDMATPWGKWFLNVVKPYWERIRGAEKTEINTSFQIADLVKKSPSTAFKAEMVPLANYCKDLQHITPPKELRKYHSKLISACENESTSRSIEDLKRTSKLNAQLSAEINQEIHRIFIKHHLPPKIIEQLTK